MRGSEHWTPVAGPALHVHGIGVEHIDTPVREIRVSGRGAEEGGPIEWETLARQGELRIRSGQGRSGLAYSVTRRREWHVSVSASAGGREVEVEVGRARMHDHALVLACLWEQAVLSGRIDMS